MNRIPGIVRYASYTMGDQEVYGTAQLVNGSGYLFRKDGERQAVLVSYTDVGLMLYGVVDLVAASQAEDAARGGAAMIACTRAQEVA